VILRPPAATAVGLRMADGSTREFHLTLRVAALEPSTVFYSWLLDVAPKTTSKHHSVIVDPRTSTNLVLIAAGASEGGSANVHHLGIGCESKHALLQIYRAALELGFDVVEPPQTTWKGTPLHQLWLRDPEGHRVEIYARLTPAELAARPADDRPLPLREAV
jgi:catechol-2,3-dioxygenase